MAIVTIKGTATVEDLLKMPKDGRKYELVDGEILVSPAGMKHGEDVVKILLIFATYLDSKPIGKVYPDNVGIWFPSGNLRSPDVFYVRNETLPNGESPEGFGELVPDLAVEVLSPSDSLTQLGRKIGEFLQCGVPIVWLADPARKTVTMYRSLSEIRQFASEDIITAEPVLPGFSCPVSRFF